MSIVKFNNSGYKSQFAPTKVVPIKIASIKIASNKIPLSEGFILLELSIALFLLMCFSLLVTVHYSSMLEHQNRAQHQLLMLLRAQSLVAQLRTNQSVPNPTFYPDTSKISYILINSAAKLPYRAIILELVWGTPPKKTVLHTGMLI